MSAPDRRDMLADKNVSIRRQFALLSLARSGVNRPLTPVRDDDLMLMARIDELFTAHHFFGDYIVDKHGTAY